MENLEDTILNMANTKQYSVDSFSPCKAKRVRYEQLDFSIYKPSANLVAFSTSEERLPRWIAAMKARYQDGLLDNQKVTTRWEEQENASDPAKCEKVTIALISKKSSENLITITASISYGRVQGKFFKEWSNQEFLQLIEIVNNSCNPDNANKDLQNFVDLLFKNETRTNLPKTTTDKQHLDTDNTSLLNEESIVNSMKNSLATLEADFGTNDLESTPSNEDMINQLKLTAISLSEKYPNSKIISSSLLPRKDDINKQINYINENLKKELSGSPNIVIVKHQNIRILDLRDNKHLNTIGVKRFAQNLKRSYFGLPFSKKPPQNSNQHRTNNQDRPQNRFTWHSNPPNTSYTPAHQIPASNQPAQQYFGKNYFSHNPHHLFNYNTPFSTQPPNYRGHNMRTKINLISQQEKGNLPTEVVELIKLLHTRYVNK